MAPELALVAHDPTTLAASLILVGVSRLHVTVQTQLVQRLKTANGALVGVRRLAVLIKVGTAAEASLALAARKFSG